MGLRAPAHTHVGDRVGAGYSFFARLRFLANADPGEIQCWCSWLTFWQRALRRIARCICPDRCDCDRQELPAGITVSGDAGVELTFGDRRVSERP